MFGFSLFSYLLLTFFSSVLALKTHSLTFRVANFTKICLGLPSVDLPTRWDTAISLGSTLGSHLISLQIFSMASSLLSCSGFSGTPVIRARLVVRAAHDRPASFAGREWHSLISAAQHLSHWADFSEVSFGGGPLQKQHRKIVHLWETQCQLSFCGYQAACRPRPKKCKLFRCHFSHVYAIISCCRAWSQYHHNTGTYT